MEVPIQRILNGIGDFSEEEKLLLSNEFQFKKLKKGDLLLESNMVCSHVWFVDSGSFCQFNYDADLNKNVLNLHIENDWTFNHKSFTSRKPSEYNIEAYENSTVYELSIEAVHKLIGLSQSFLKMGRILAEDTSSGAILEKQKTPDEKYLYLLKERPKLLQKFPQTVLASYLKITPETLSRVRKRIF